MGAPAIDAIGNGMRRPGEQSGGALPSAPEAVEERVTEGGRPPAFEAAVIAAELPTAGRRSPLAAPEWAPPRSDFRLKDVTV
jgi:hypothetical protein